MKLLQKTIVPVLKNKCEISLPKSHNLLEDLLAFSCLIQEQWDGGDENNLLILSISRSVFTLSQTER